WVHLFVRQFFFLLLRRAPGSTLFPYTTLFRSITILFSSSFLNVNPAWLSRGTRTVVHGWLLVEIGANVSSGSKSSIYIKRTAVCFSILLIIVFKLLSLSLTEIFAWALLLFANPCKVKAQTRQAISFVINRYL